MAERHVTCINKPNHLSSHEHITHIGNAGEGWREGYVTGGDYERVSLGRC